MTESKPQVSAETRKLITAAFKGAEEITAGELAEIVGKDDKTVRAHMRKAAYRDQSTEKNNRWKITKEVALSVAEHYAPKAEKAS